MAGEGWRDAECWSGGFEAANRTDQGGEDEDEDEDEDEEPEGGSLVGEDEDGRLFPTMMLADSWRRLENAKRAGEKRREAMQACTACGQPMPPSIPHEKKKKRQHKKHKEGGFKRKCRRQKAEATEAIEAAQGEAVGTAAKLRLGYTLNNGPGPRGCPHWMCW